MVAAKSLSHDYAPMEALLVKALPKGPEWQYEPKWDGFRCIAYKDHDQVDLRSKKGQPLGRYFPEVVESILKLDADPFIVDGELVIWINGVPSFDDLLQRIHPAATRIKKLSTETPATFILFDMLQDTDGTILTEELLPVRRQALAKFSEDVLGKNKSVILSPFTDDVDVANAWLSDSGTQLDGVICKRTDVPYQSGNRKGMVKVKRMKTADCVVGGFRYGANSNDIGSLLLGLFDENGNLHHVGFTSALTGAEKKKITGQVKPLIASESFTVNVPGGPSRWSTERSTQWTPLKPELVVEVQYDHMTNGRFRHGTKILRWRPDKSPKQCTFEQLGI